MRSALSHRLGAATLSVLSAFIVFGVLSMHSVTPMATSTSGGHASMASPPAVDSSVLAAFGEHDCPSTHQMMHPCQGTTVTWSALSIPMMSTEVGMPPSPADQPGRQAHTTQERAPPWTLWELDRSVTLRV